MTATVIRARLSRCCHAATRNGRCVRCGHRIAVGGIPPVQTRDLMAARPWAAPLIAFRELAGRHAARRNAP